MIDVVGVVFMEGLVTVMLTSSHLNAMEVFVLYLIFFVKVEMVVWVSVLQLVVESGQWIERVMIRIAIVGVVVH